MKNDRRKFIRTAGALTAGGFILPQFACGDVDKADNTKEAEVIVEQAAPTAAGSIDQFGIQLYSLKDVLPDDPKGVLKNLSDYGYKQLEGFEGDQGIYWNMVPGDFKKYISDLGMTMVASHCNIYEDFEKKAAEAAEVGLSYLICPYVGPQKSVEDWKKITDKFNECGAVCKQNGIRFAYHNHAYSFKAFSGMIPQDYMMENTDPDLVDHEMDIYWVVTGGASPIEYLEKYPNRFRLCHVKDRAKDAGDEQMASCNLGTGTIDFPSILKVAEEKGMKYFIVEQERYVDTTPLQSAEANADYLAKLKFA